MKGITEEGDSTRFALIIADGYQVMTTYNLKTGEFISTNRGLWSLNGNTMTEEVELYTDKPEMVGQELSFKIDFTGNSMRIIGE